MIGIENNFSKKLKYLRDKLGITKYRLAKEIDTAPINISNYEDGKTEPSLQTLYKIKSLAVKNGVEWDIW